MALEPICIEAGEALPFIDFDENNNKFVIAGKSYEENVDDFYPPIIKWLDEYIKNVNRVVSLDIYLQYFNTSSSKYLYEILRRFRSLKLAGADVVVDWRYDAEDEDMATEIHEFSQLVNLDINIIPEEE